MTTKNKTISKKINIAIINYEHALASSIIGMIDIFSIVNNFCLVNEESEKFHVDVFVDTHSVLLGDELVYKNDAWIV